MPLAKGMAGFVPQHPDTYNFVPEFVKRTQGAG